MTKLKAMIVASSDYRYQEQIQNLIKSEGLKYGEYELILIQGGAGNFGQLEAHLKNSYRLLRPKYLFLLVHQDCRYGSKPEDLNKAREIAEEFTTEVYTCYIKLKNQTERGAAAAI